MPYFLGADVFSCFFLGGYPTNLPWHKETCQRENKLRLNVFFSSQVLDERIEALVI